MKKFTIFFSFLLLFTFFFVGSSYASELPELPTIERPVYEYIYYTSSGGDYPCLAVISTTAGKTLESLKVNVAGNGVLRIQLLGQENDFYVDKYEYHNDSWIHTGIGSSTHPTSYSTISYGGNLSDLLYSTVDIYRTLDGEEIFFQKAPILTTPTVEEMIAEEVPIMAEKVTQTMKIILLCGVGCLALLIGLPLFGRVFRMFHVK